MKLIFSVLFCLAVGGPSVAWSQLYITRTGFAGFYSKTALEDIRGENNQVYAIVDAGKQLTLSMWVKLDDVSKAGLLDWGALSLRVQDGKLVARGEGKVELAGGAIGAAHWTHVALRLGSNKATLFVGGAQDELAGVLLSEGVVEERDVGRAHVRIAGGRRGDADLDGTGRGA